MLGLVGEWFRFAEQKYVDTGAIPAGWLLRALGGFRSSGCSESSGPPLNLAHGALQAFGALGTLGSSGALGVLEALRSL